MLLAEIAMLLCLVFIPLIGFYTMKLAVAAFYLARDQYHERKQSTNQTEEIDEWL